MKAILYAASVEVLCLFVSMSTALAQTRMAEDPAQSISSLKPNSVTG